VDLADDPDNCGRCDTVCPSAEGGAATCEDAVCRDPCVDIAEVPGGQPAECGGACVSLNVDSAHCGACNQRCDLAYYPFDLECLDGYNVRSCDWAPRGCAAGNCGVEIIHEWRQGESADPGLSCDQVCEDAGMVCGSGWAPIEGCGIENPDGRFVGCALYNDGLCSRSLRCDEFSSAVRRTQANTTHRTDVICRCDLPPVDAPDGVPEALLDPAEQSIEFIAPFGDDTVTVPVRFDLSARYRITIAGEDGMGCPRGAFTISRDNREVARDANRLGPARCLQVERFLDAGRYDLEIGSFDDFLIDFGTVLTERVPP
jgi:hypothetical protein